MSIVKDGQDLQYRAFRISLSGPAEMAIRASYKLERCFFCVPRWGLHERIVGALSTTSHARLAPIRRPQRRGLAPLQGPPSPTSLSLSLSLFSRACAGTTTLVKTRLVLCPSHFLVPASTQPHVPVAARPLMLAPLLSHQSASTLTIVRCWRRYLSARDPNEYLVAPASPLIASPSSSVRLPRLVAYLVLQLPNISPPSSPRIGTTGGVSVSLSFYLFSPSRTAINTEIGS